MGQRVIWDNANCEKQLQLEARVCTAAFWLVYLKLQQLTKLEVIETEWPMQDYRFIFHALLLQKTVSLNENFRVIWDTFVRKWHMNSISFFASMVSHDNLNICEPSYLEIPIIETEFFCSCLPHFLNDVPYFPRQSHITCTRHRR